MSDMDNEEATCAPVEGAQRCWEEEEAAAGEGESLAGEERGERGEEKRWAGRRRPLVAANGEQGEELLVDVAAAAEECRLSCVPA